MRELTSTETNEVNGGVFVAIARYVAGRVLGPRAAVYFAAATELSSSSPQK